MAKSAFSNADTEKMLSLPVGAISPLWLMFAGAATVGAAYFWSRAFFKPVNVEALFKAPEVLKDATVDIAETVIETVETEAQVAVNVIESIVETTSDVIDETVEAAPGPAQEMLAAMAPEPVPAISDVVEAATETWSRVIDAAPEASPEPENAPEPVAAEAAPADDLTVLSGIGPKLAAALAERGVTRFAQIAAWTDEDIAGFDRELKLMGRIGREAWIAQATRLAH